MVVLNTLLKPAANTAQIIKCKMSIYCNREFSNGATSIQTLDFYTADIYGEKQKQKKMLRCRSPSWYSGVVTQTYTDEKTKRCRS